MSFREQVKVSKYGYKGNFYARFDTRGVLTPFDTCFLVSSPIRKSGIFFVGHKDKTGYTVSLYRLGMKFKTYSNKTEAVKNFAHNISHYTFDQIERAADSNHDLNTIHPSRAYTVDDPGATITKNPTRKKAANKQPNPYKYRIRSADGRLHGTGIGGKSWFTLAEAKQIVNRDKGQNIIEICPVTGRVLWEVF